MGVTSIRPFEKIFVRRCSLSFDLIKDFTPDQIDELSRKHEIQQVFSEHHKEKFELLLRKLPEKKARKTLSNYLLRSAGRPTPSGSLVICSMGSVGTSLHISPVDGKTDKITIASGKSLLEDYLLALQKEDFPAGRRLFLNPTVLEVSGIINYFKLKDGGNFSPFFLKLDKSLLGYLLKKEEGFGISDFRKAFKTHLTLSEAKELLKSLLDHQVILADYFPDIFNGVLASSENDSHFVKEKSWLQLDTESVAKIGKISQTLLSSYAPGFTDPLYRRFLQDFKLRYGDGPVPLLEALSPQGGLEVPPMWAFQKTPEVFQVILKKIGELPPDKMDLELKYEDIPVVSHSNQPVISSLVSWTNNRIHLIGVSGHPGTQLVGRFNRSWPELNKFIQEIEKDIMKSAPAIIHSRFACFEGDLKDELSRQSKTLFEVINVFNGKTNEDIPLNDLLLAADDNEFYLFSRSQKKRVIPVITDAVVQDRCSLPHHRFFRALADATSTRYYCNFPFPKGVSRLPRVTLDGIVIAPARWQITAKTLVQYLRDGNLQKHYQTPDWIKAGTADMLIPIKTNDPRWAVLVEDSFEANTSLSIEEFFPEDALKIDGKTFIAEQIIFYSCLLEAHPAHSLMPDSVDRSNALYWQIPLHKDSMNDFVSREFLPFLKSHKKLKSFFIIYNDPDLHIRFRILGVKLNERSKLRDMMEKRFSLWQKNKWIGPVRLLTYFPEVFSYGGKKGIECYEEYGLLDTRIMTTLNASRFSIAVFSIIANAQYAFKNPSDAIEELEKYIKILSVNYEPGHLERDFLRDFGLMLASDSGPLIGLKEDFTPFAKERQKIWKKIDGPNTKKFFERFNHLSNNRLGLSHARSFELSAYISAARALAKIGHFNQKLF